MAKYEYMGRKYEFPDGISEEEALRIMQQDSMPQQGRGSNAAPTFAGGVLDRPKDAKITTTDLSKDQNWIDASRILYAKYGDGDKNISNEDLHEWMLEQQAKINWHTPSMAMVAAQARSMSPLEKKALLYTMDAYDRSSTDWTVAGNTALSLIADPLNYVGVGVVTNVGKATGATGAKAALKNFLKRGIMTGIEGAAMAGGQNVIEQTIRVNAGGQQEVDLGQAGVAAGIGLVGGTVLGGAIGTLAERRAAKLTADIVPSNLPGEAAQSVDNAIGTLGSSEGQRIVTGAANDNLGATLPNPVEVPAIVGNEAPGVLPRVGNDTGAAIVPTPANDVGTGILPTPANDVAAASVKATADVATNVEAKTDADGIIDAIRKVSADSGSRILYRVKDELTQATTEAVNLLKNLGVNTAEEAVEVIRRAGFTQEQQQVLVKTAQKAAQDLGDALEKAAKEGADPETMDDLVQLQSVVQNLDLALSTNSGLNLGGRGKQGLFAVGENRSVATPELFAKSQGREWSAMTPDERAAVTTQWADERAAAREQAAKHNRIVEMDREIDRLYRDGDITTATRLASEKRALVEAAADELLEKQGVKANILEKARKATNVAVEWVISTVFTPRTLVVNAIPSIAKTIYKPLTNSIVKGFDEAARREMTVAYRTMWDMRGTAFRAARAVFDYERPLLTGDADKFLEVEPAIKGNFGRFVRGFSRFLSATDEFFSQIHYRSFIAGNAEYEAVVLGRKKGLDGDALNEFVQQRVDKAVAGAYEAEFSPAETIDFLLDQGVRRGFSGEALEDYVRVEMAKNGDLFKQATGETGKDYVKDFLFKREFKGEGAMGLSKGARAYEEFVHKYPVMRLLGQLFFRTPVRVFEEGIRLTPGLNLISPRFMEDLAGKNGTQRMIRAKGEALASYGFGMSVMMAYSNGNITGGGPDDYKQRRNLENTGWQPYSIKVGDSWYSFRNLDPLATPLKIMVNALDRFGKLQERKASGELLDKEENEALAFLSVGIGAVAQAIRDANLTEGLSQLLDLGEMAMDPEETAYKWVKFFGEKARLAVPNVIQQGRDLVAELNGEATPFTDARTMEQYLRVVVNPRDSVIPRQYDALGNLREKPSNLLPFFGVALYDRGDSKTGKNEKEQQVLEALSAMEMATGVKFVAPFKNETYLGDVDLRTVMTADGSTTLYDRWMQLYNKSGVIDALYVAMQQGGSTGTKEFKGVKVEQARSIISDFREAAFARMMAEEQQIPQKYFERMTKKSQSLQGEFDFRYIQDYR